MTFKQNNGSARATGIPHRRDGEWKGTLFAEIFAPVATPIAKRSENREPK
jgi:hypothetical protein